MFGILRIHLFRNRTVDQIIATRSANVRAAKQEKSHSGYDEDQPNWQTKADLVGFVQHNG
jgi:hypothetical protein